MSEAQLERIESAVTRIESTVEQVKTDVAGLKTDVGRLDAGQVELGRHMRLLHEDALDRIAALGSLAQSHHTATKQDLADLEERLNQRLDPLAMAVRAHSREIADLQRSRDAH